MVLSSHDLMELHHDLNKMPHTSHMAQETTITDDPAKVANYFAGFSFYVYWLLVRRDQSFFVQSYSASCKSLIGTCRQRQVRLDGWKSYNRTLHAASCLCRQFQPMARQ